MSAFGGRGNNAFIEASTRPLSSILMTFTSTSSPISRTSATFAVRVHAISEICTNASVLSKRLTKAPNFSIRTTLAW
ncbi:hypothetical protein SAL_0239 [Streptococcus agalactiae 515]|nr:hypothetical protein SAL_0239 [Streptococcus agalactiae 515]